MRELVDRVYEAAFVPEQWNRVLQGACDLSASASGQVLFFSPNGPPRGITLDNLRPVFNRFIKGDFWTSCASVQRICSVRPASFVRVEDLVPAEEIARDPLRIMLRKFGIGAHLCTAIPMPTGELAIFVFQKWTNDGGYEQDEIDKLNALRPHLERASLVAGRIGIERAEATSSTLDLMGWPAAVLSSGGRVMAMNPRLARMSATFLPVAFGGLAIADANANERFQAAMERMNRAGAGGSSIPVPAIGDEPALVIHLLPLRRVAHDIFGGAETLILATPIAASQLAPSATLLNVLFDMTPAEARLATDLTGGLTLAESAAKHGVTVKSSRTYLERIFRKTGIHRQGQLVAMLKTVQPHASPPSG
ncbi:MAG TPA: helix-turn-helix transcriptional regulator [Bauldia sp.]|nr:helix-turn-helix transcriptional regulator [Bauldia sp.]